MKTLIRCDASYMIGSGHVVRCLNLAIKLKSTEHQIAFAMRNSSGNLIHLVKANGFEVFEFEAEPDQIISKHDGYKNWLCASDEHELSEMESAVRKFNPDNIIVDHYGISQDWESAFRKKGIKIVSIDDLGRNHDSDVILDQNYNPETWELYRHNSPTAKLLLGPEFAILKDVFFLTEPIKEVELEHVNQILVFFGGADTSNETGKLISALQTSKTGNAAIKIIIGPQNKNIDSIRQNASSNKNIQFLTQVENMAELMKESQLLIGAGGTITWEKCRIGLPSICIAIAKNQIKVSKLLHESNAHLYLGEANEVTIEKLSGAISQMVQNTEIRKTQNRALISFKSGNKTSEIDQIFK